MNNCSTTVDDHATKVTIRLQATPPERELVVDDARASADSFIGTFTQNGMEYNVTASAPGYESRSQAAKFSDDVSMRFGLARAAAEKDK